jgi:putative SOS response-associated peptidase YedK
VLKTRRGDPVAAWLAPAQPEGWMKGGANRSITCSWPTPPAMEDHRVSRAVNTPRSNSEALLDPV